MRKFILAAFLGMMCLSKASAQNVPPTTCVPVTISSSVPTEVSGNTTSVTTSSATWFVSVMNLDTANNIYCSHDSAVATSGTHQGVPIIYQSAATNSFNWFAWQIGMLEPWYCKAATASVTAMVCRYR